MARGSEVKQRPQIAIASLRDEKFCYLTTIGRLSGQPREIEIWFNANVNTVYLLSGGRDRSDWVRNLMRQPRISLRIVCQEFKGSARVVDAQSEEDSLARALLVKKYQTQARDLSNWGRSSLPIAIDIDP